MEDKSLAAFQRQALQRIAHIVDATFLYQRAEVDLAEMLDPEHWPGAQLVGPDSRAPLLERGALGFLQPMDGNRYLVWVRDMDRDGRPVLDFVRFGPPPAPESSVAPTSPPPAKRAA